jgi:hypothetical protein
MDSMEEGGELAVETIDAKKNRYANPTRASMKTVWIITYNASGPYIDPSILFKLGGIEVDECHSTKDQIIAYTYIHLIKRIRQSSIEKFMKQARDVHGIVRNEIFGFDSIVCNVRQKNILSMQGHPGFQMLVKHFVEKNVAFRAWTDGDPVLKRGLILKSAELDTLAVIEQRTKAQIIQYTKKLELRLREAAKQGFSFSSKDSDCDSPEFDVVKKRRAMDSALSGEDDDDPDALEAFENFELNVLPALKRISADDRKYHDAELQDFEEKAAKGIIQPTTGGVYFAYSPCLR